MPCAHASDPAASGIIARFRISGSAVIPDIAMIVVTGTHNSRYIPTHAIARGLSVVGVPDLSANRLYSLICAYNLNIRYIGMSCVSARAVGWLPFRA